MELADNIEVLNNIIKNNEMVLVYFKGISCNVCTAMKPKLENLFSNYPKIKNIEVDVEKSPEISSYYNVFSIPALLFFIDGKEVIREARIISIQNLENKIARYYGLYYEK